MAPRIEDMEMTATPSIYERPEPINAYNSLFEIFDQIDQADNRAVCMTIDLKAVTK
jgi:hypothetical protein